MAVIGDKWPTLTDYARRLDPDDKIARIIEMLNQTNPVLDDMVFLEGNLVTGHKSTIRTGLPEPTWRMLYQGVQPSKSRTAQVVDTTGMLEAYAEIDKALADLNGNKAAFRLSEDAAHLEGMNQELASTVFYGNSALNPEQFMGLSPRFNSLSAENGANIITAGGVGSDNASIWLVVWGPNTVHGIYPKGSKAGWTMDDKGQVTIENIDGAGGRMEAYRTHYRWDAGLVVRDWRYVVRIANIDVSDLKKDAATGADLIDLMIQALEMVPSLSMGRPVFYAPRPIASFLRRQILNKSNLLIGMDEVAGKKATTFDGVPIRRVDSLLTAEAAVT